MAGGAPSCPGDSGEMVAGDGADHAADMLTILVEAREEESVVTTSLRAMGMLDVAKVHERMAAEEDADRLARR